MCGAGAALSGVRAAPAAGISAGTPSFDHSHLERLFLDENTTEQ